MNHLKLFEDFSYSNLENKIISNVNESNGVESFPDTWSNKQSIIIRTGGFEFFDKRELDFFHEFFIKSNQNDFFNVSGKKVSGFGIDGSELSGGRRSKFRLSYMPADNKVNPIRVYISRLKDEYFLVEIRCLSNKDSRYSEYNNEHTAPKRLYLIDSFEDLKDFIFNIKNYWIEVNSLPIGV